MADYKRYLEKKVKGQAQLFKINDAYAIYFNRFDPETGEALAPEIQAIGKDELLKEKAELESHLADINAVVADMEAQ